MPVSSVLPVMMLRTIRAAQNFLYTMIPQDIRGFFLRTPAGRAADRAKFTLSLRLLQKQGHPHTSTLDRHVLVGTCAAGAGERQHFTSYKPRPLSLRGHHQHVLGPSKLMKNKNNSLEDLEARIKVSQTG